MPGNAKDTAALNNAKSSVMPDDAPDDKQPCPLMKRLRLGVFFDGTNNNRYRDEATHHETNVDRLYKVYHTNEDEIAVRDRLYVIGVGAVDPKNETFSDANRSLQATGDNRVKDGVEAMSENPDVLDLRVFTAETDKLGSGLGLAFGLGARERLNIAYKWVKDKVDQHHAKNHLKESEKVVDVYGFSRGSAIARTFDNLIMQGLHKQEGYENVRVRFLGIFDTVGSVGIPGSLPGGWLNPGLNLGLDSADFDACSHFTARNEYRANFPLSELPGYDQEYAGCHSDVGGGYADGDPAGTHNWLAFLTLHDMWAQSTLRKVEMDKPAITVDVEKLRADANDYDGAGASMYDPNGSWPKERDKWMATYVHNSSTEVGAAWYMVSPLGAAIVQYFNPNKPRTEGFWHPQKVREKFVHKRKTLVGLPPSFSWKG